jgi:hypothetical protein
MGDMKLIRFVTAASIGLLASLAPASASAKILELGQTSTPLIAPVCPPGVTAANCKIVLTEVTALETIRDGVSYPTKATKAGQIVAFTVGLSRLDPNAATAKSDVHFLDSTYLGTTQLAITVLRPVGKAKFFRWAVVAESPIYHVQPYLGDVVQFPLATSLPIKPGYAVALTVPTWAPVLSFNLNPKKFAYRQSRSANCSNPAAIDQAQLLIGASTRYGCDYPGTRVEYTATEITNPAPPKNQIHAPDRRGRAARAAALRPRILSRSAG